MNVAGNNHLRFAKTGAICSLLAHLISSPVIHASPLGDLAATMPAKSWAKLTGTENFGNHIFDDGGGHNILQFSDNAIWDPITRRFLYLGSGHRRHSKFISYSEATNNWRNDLSLPVPCMYEDDNWCSGHNYDHGAIDVAGRTFYRRNGSSVYAYDLTNNTWSTLPTMPAGPTQVARRC